LRSQPDPTGGLAPNQSVRNAAAAVAGLAVSMKMTDSPGPMEAIPFSATALANVCESSSILQPEIVTAVVPALVTSNQSA
jgi:hypothetical protein